VPFALLIVALALALAVRPGAQSPALGDISFPNSGTIAAQPAFLRGVAWLHSFGYEDAIESFREAQALDPAFLLAYWGEAMCYRQPIWYSEDVAAAREALARLGVAINAQGARPPTPRERLYLDAVFALYSEKPEAARESEYSSAMERLSAAYPDDDEAAVFYALSLLDLVPRGGTDRALSSRAGAIAERVFARNPRHPGAAHVIIHAYDNRDQAARALPAARAYAAIAPSSSHALHMPSHIFMQLGWWNAATATNEASWQASVDRVERLKLSPADRDYHSLGWLQYEYLQQGRYRAARELERHVEDALKEPARSAHAAGMQHGELGLASDPASLRNELANFRARHVIESRDWTRMIGQGNFDNVDELFALGMSAARSGDVARAEAAWGIFARESQRTGGAEDRKLGALMEREMGALYYLAAGKAADAKRLIREAAAIEETLPLPIGRPYPVKPAFELMGEMLLDMNEAEAAAVAFERSLERIANRSLSVLGFARALTKLGRQGEARRQYARLLANWRTADQNLPELAEARHGAGSEPVPTDDEAVAREAGVLTSTSAGSSGPATAAPGDESAIRSTAAWRWVAPLVLLAAGLGAGLLLVRTRGKRTTAAGSPGSKQPPRRRGRDR
jgi:tetratricopeptide (TPR) repeat protein